MLGPAPCSGAARRSPACCCGGHTALARTGGGPRGLLLCVSSLITIGLAELMFGLGQSGTAASEPAHVATLPPPAALAGDRGATEPSGEREVTIAVLGESSAAGVPFDRWLSVGKIVGWQLEQVIPGQSCRVVTLAEPGVALEGQHEKLSRLRQYLDALIVYCGHNEFAATIPSSRRLAYYVDEKPSLVERIDDLLARVSPLCRLIRQSADRIRAGLLPQSGLRPPLVDGPACTDAEHAMRLAEFRRHLDEIVVHCKLKGTLAILVVPPANDAGFDPNRSFLPAQTTREAREAFAREFLAARGLEATDPGRAEKLYRSLLQAQPGFAETHYRLGRLLKNAGAWDEAYDHFVRARDCDGMPIRCLSSFQDVYREVAARRGCPLVDGQTLFHALGARMACSTIRCSWTQCTRHSPARSRWRRESSMQSANAEPWTGRKRHRCPGSTSRNALPTLDWVRLNGDSSPSASSSSRRALLCFDMNRASDKRKLRLFARPSSASLKVRRPRTSDCRI